MSNTHISKRPVFETYQQYAQEVAPALSQAISEITGKTERDDSSVDGGKPKDELTALGYKVCGAFALREATAPIDVNTEDGAKVLEQGESFMSIHLLEVGPEHANIAYGRQSLREAAQYLRETDTAADMALASITYARLGQTAHRAFGFEVTELPILPDPFENPDARPVLVHMPIAEFIENN